MAANISGLHQFADDVGPLPLKLLDDSYSTLTIALNTLATFSNFYSDTGTTNAYTIQTPQYQFVVYSDGLEVTVRIANTNTGASTLNVNGLGAVPILTSIGSELQPNALVAGSIVTFVYNAQRQAWQIGSGGGAGGGQITAPLHVTNPTGQAALSINVDGSGYLGDFNGNGLSWDGACNFTFEGGATLSGITPDFRINTVVSASAGEPQLELRADGYSGITAWPSGTAVNLEANGGGALGTPPCQLEWDANCNWIFGGDSKVTIPNVALGTAPNQILIDSNGNLTTTGTATLPPAASISSIGDVTITNPQNGQSLIYNAATQQWINSTPVTTLVALSDVHVGGPAPGQVLTYSISPVPGWVNATIPGYNFLSNLGVGPNPQPGWVLTWDGVAWVGAAPGEVAQFPLSSLTDVGITTPLNRQVLTYDAPNAKWINAPAAMPSLATLPDVQLTSQTNGQALTWNSGLARWVNSTIVQALAGLTDVAVSSPSVTQVLAWDGTHWANASLPGGAEIDTLAALLDVQVTNPANAQMLYYNGPTQRWVNGNPSITQLGDVHTSAPTTGQVLTYQAGTGWVNAAVPSGALAALSDVALGGPYNGAPLTYNYSTQMWQAGGPVSINNSLNVALATTLSGNVTCNSYLTVANTATLNGGANIRQPFGVIDAAYNAALNVDTNGLVSVNNAAGTASKSGIALTVTGAPSYQALNVVGLGIATSATSIAKIGTTSTAAVTGLTIQAGGTSRPPFYQSNGAGQGFALRVAINSTNASGTVDVLTITENYVQIGDVPTTTGPVNCRLEPTWGNFISVTSSCARHKRDIRSVARERAREVVKKLRPVSYRSKCEHENPDVTYYGFIAEEVAEADPYLVTYDKEGRPQSVHYERIAALLVPLMRELLGFDEPEVA